MREQSLWKTKGERMQSQWRRPCEDGGRDWSDAVTNQGMPGATRNWKRQERLSHRVSGANWPCWHLDFRLLSSRTVKKWISVVLKFVVIYYSSNRKLTQRGFLDREIRFPRSMVFKQLFQGLDPLVQVEYYLEDESKSHRNSPALAEENGQSPAFLHFLHPQRSVRS